MDVTTSANAKLYSSEHFVTVPCLFPTNQSQENEILDNSANNDMKKGYYFLHYTANCFAQQPILCDLLKLSI